MNDLLTIWYKGEGGNLYTFEELKLVYMEAFPAEKFMLCNFNAWTDSKKIYRIN